MIEDLKDVIKSLKDPKGVNLLSLIGEIVPKEAAPVSKFIEAIIPPHIIKATAYLQWRSNVSDGHVAGDVADKVGITFKFVDLSNQRNLMVRTLWWQPEDAAKEDTRMRPAARPNTNHKPVSNEVAERYIDLLEPATYWMVLMFWEQKLLSNIPLENRVVSKFERKRQARIFYLLGTLYYAYADQYPAHKVFFCNLAVEHFREAMAKDANWDLPYLYLANLYTFKAQEIQREMEKLEMLRQDVQNQVDKLVKVRQDMHHLKEKSDKLSHDVKDLKEKSDKLSHDAKDLYKKALNRARTIYTKHRIRLDMALADLVTGLVPRNPKLLAKAFQQVEELQKDLDPADFSWERADCAVYLYNLATWYIIALDRSVTMIGVNALEKARRYLAYSLARSEDMRDMLEKDAKFDSMRISRDIELLLKILEEVRKENDTLAKLTGKDFRDKLYSVSQKIDEHKRALFNIQLSDGVS
jgi:FtsZ-binding cell division protein ZapB